MIKNKSLEKSLLKKTSILLISTIPFTFPGSVHGGSPVEYYEGECILPFDTTGPIGKHCHTAKTKIECTVNCDEDRTKHNFQGKDEVGNIITATVEIVNDGQGNVRYETGGEVYYSQADAQAAVNKALGGTQADGVYLGYDPGDITTIDSDGNTSTSTRNEREESQERWNTITKTVSNFFAQVKKALTPKPKPEPILPPTKTGGNNNNNDTSGGNLYDYSKDESGDNACFKGTAQIKKPFGENKKIKDILPGEKVLGRNNEEFTVFAVITHDGKQSHKNDFSKYPLIKVTFEDKTTLDIVDTHPVFVKKDGETFLKRTIEIGDVLVGTDNKDLKVISLEKDFTTEETVYELDLNGLRNKNINPSYFVDNVLVDEYVLTREELYLSQK